MIKDINEVREKLVAVLREYEGVLKITSDTTDKFEVTGTIPAMQGKKQVDGMYFATVIPKLKDVRLYFFPVYTHREEIGALPADLKKALKGKSCFHVKSIDEAFEANLRALVKQSIVLYQEAGLLKV